MLPTRLCTRYRLVGAGGSPGESTVTQDSGMDIPDDELYSMTLETYETYVLPPLRAVFRN